MRESRFNGETQCTDNNSLFITKVMPTLMFSPFMPSLMYVNFMPRVKKLFFHCTPHTLSCCRGLSYISTSMGREGLANRFVHEKAPRTAMIVHENGSLSLMQVSPPTHNV